MTDATERIAGITTIALALALTASAGTAQDASLEDGRWLPYLGCWVEAQEDAGPMTCLVPDGDGVEVLTVVEATIADRRALRADGVERAAVVTGCTAREAAEFSTDGTRVYTRSVLACGGDTERRSRGIMALVGPDQWVEIRALNVQDGGAAWIQRYRPAPTERILAAGLIAQVPSGRTEQAAKAARMAASGPVTVDEIIEANARTAPEAVRAWLAEQGDPIRLDADRLIRLADAGVPESVIDVAVAVSFPDRFAVGQASRADREPLGYDRYFGYGPMWSPYGYWGYGRYGYDRWGYNRWYDGWYYGGYPGRSPVVVVVRPTTETRPSGRLVRGRGYTQGSSGTVGPATRRPSTVRAKPPRGGGGAAVSRGTSTSSGSKGKAKRRGGN